MHIPLYAVVVFLVHCRCNAEPASVITKDVASSNILIVRLDPGISYSWKQVSGTRNLTVLHPPDVIVDIQEQSGGQLKVDARTAKSSIASATLPTVNVGLLAVLALTWLTGGTSKWYRLVLCLSLACLLTGIMANVTEEIASSSIHIVVPSQLISSACFNGECSTIFCRLSPSSDYSNVPSNSPIFADGNCTIKKPDRWDEWLRYHFGTEATMQDYYGDVDGDGFVNILEYHGFDAFGTRPYNQTTGGTRSTRDVRPIQDIGTNPTKSDTDGDLLMDGFEVKNALNPRVVDPTSADYDKDTLSNLDEQIHGLDPLNPDSDGDGIPDGEEVKRGSNANDPRDEGEQPSNVDTAVVRLTVGDHSGSHSERYILHVGTISHQSPGYGLVGSGDYTVSTGSYEITLQHAGSNLPSPDFDYTATVTKLSGKARISIEDPLRMLGVHDESNPFYASGKSAKLIVEADCSSMDTSCQCAQRRLCTECLTDDKCTWNVDDKTCKQRKSYHVDVPEVGVCGVGYVSSTVINAQKCPCERCQKWYDTERSNKSWLQQLNTEIPCPCTTRSGVYSRIPVGQSEANWGVDIACAVRGYPSCANFHPGADGCIRSEMTSSAGSRQQCCYDASGRLIAPGGPGAGTPDRSASFCEHQKVDVEPYRWCCKQCEKANFCAYYINDVRKGDNSHCK